MAKTIKKPAIFYDAGFLSPALSSKGELFCRLRSVSSQQAMLLIYLKRWYICPLNFQMHRKYA